MGRLVIQEHHLLVQSRQLVPGVLGEAKQEDRKSKVVRFGTGLEEDEGENMGEVKSTRCKGEAQLDRIK